MDQNANKVNKFWTGYYEAVVESGIPEKTAEWYVNWAQKFAVSVKNPGPEGQALFYPQRGFALLEAQWCQSLNSE